MSFRYADHGDLAISIIGPSPGSVIAEARRFHGLSWAEIGPKDVGSGHRILVTFETKAERDRAMRELVLDQI